MGYALMKVFTPPHPLPDHHLLAGSFTCSSLVSPVISETRARKKVRHRKIYLHNPLPSVPIPPAHGTTRRLHKPRLLYLPAAVVPSRLSHRHASSPLLACSTAPVACGALGQRPRHCAVAGAIEGPRAFSPVLFIICLSHLILALARPAFPQREKRILPSFFLPHDTSPPPPSQASRVRKTEWVSGHVVVLTLSHTHTLARAPVRMHHDRLRGMGWVVNLVTDVMMLTSIHAADERERK